MQEDLFGQPVHDPARSMKDFFIVPPFSILDTTDGAWQRRKKRWNDLIGDLGNTRENTLKPRNDNTDSEIDLSIQNFNNGVSILDAVMAEVLVKWFTEPGHLCFDPFAGDTVFGFVSAYMERVFTGLELRQEQVDFNQQAVDKHQLHAKYTCADSMWMDRYVEDKSQDFIFSCPPYADLEVYSDLPGDLSTMSHSEFFRAYTHILQQTFNKLKWNRFACIVISEVRDQKTGLYLRLVPKTVDIMTGAGYSYYNEIILINSPGTLPMRSGKQMNSGRKVGRRHQNILVFYKGDPKEIKNNFSELIPKNEYYES